MRTVVLFLSVILSGALVSSARAEAVSEGREIFQRIEVSNDGHVAVSDASILYGNSELLRGPAVRSYAAGNARRHTFSQGLDHVIPEQTRIHWVTEDGISHEAAIATRSLIRNLDVFYGFRFYFVDDHVDVYLIERVPNPSQNLSLKYTKAYSSTASEPVPP